MHRFLITIRSFASSFVLLCLLFQVNANAQTNTIHPIADWLESYRPGGDFKQVQLLRLQNDQNRATRPAIENATLLHLDPAPFDELRAAPYPTLSLRIPNAYGTDFDLELVQVDLFAEGFTLGTLGNQPQENVDYQVGAHYRGIIRGNPNSIVAVSLTSQGLMGMITDETGTYTIGRMEDGSEDYILYRREDLPTSAPHACFNDELEGSDLTETGPGDRGVGCRTVQIYFECDYKLYTDKGSSTTGVTDYVTSLFNQITALYANENVGVAISQIYVWTSPDPYQGMTSTSSVLNSFRTTRGTSFNGQLAHFLTTRNLGGGIAYVDVICSKSYAYGVSAIYTSFQNVPTYSWSVEVVTHELGHNLGSWHTQSCNWTGGALDNCVSPEGSCSPGPAPSNGGTIMSYCHLSNYGINFNNGFGTQPGNRIRERVTAATCAPQAGTVPTGLATNNITGTSATLQWGTVPGATRYTIQYKLASASTWTSGSSTTATSHNLSGLTANTAYNWQVKTDCSGYSATANFTTTTGSGGGTCSAPSNLNSSSITTTSATVSWSTVNGATNYTVQYKTSAASTWMTAGTTAGTIYNLTGLTASTAYNWQVKASCSGYSAAASFATANAGGGTCTAPTGSSTGNLATTSVTLNWGGVSGATSYTVQFKTATSTTWMTTSATSGISLNLTGLTVNTAYNWQVKANCSGYSAVSNFTTLNTSSGTCNAPGGLVTSDISTGVATFNWSAVSGATSYTVQFKATSSQFWSTAGTSSSTIYTVNGLAAGSSYHWRVKANCSGYSAIVTFITAPNGGGQQCSAPVNLTNSAVGSTWAVIAWSPVSGAASYTLQIKVASSTTYITLGTVGSTQVTLNGMQASTSYHWRVKANCSAYSTEKLLTTAASLTQPQTDGLPEIASLALFPNPTTDFLNLRFHTPTFDAEVLVTDAVGKLMLRQPFLLDQQQLNVSSLPGGVYFLTLWQGGAKMATERFVKM